MIEGASIANEFTRIFACKFLFDKNSHACWPGVGVNYTTKTQYLFRINKGIHNCQDKIHKLISEDRVSYVVPGNYESASLLDVTVKGLLKRMRR